MKVADIQPGHTFGRWTIKRDLGRNENNQPYFHCVCECGTEKPVNGYSLLKGDSTSCGCYRREVVGDLFRTHGQSHTPLHNIWMGIIQRCTDEKRPAYQWYGARGIKVCDAWKDDFMAFHDWAHDNGYEEDLTIERIDNDGDYEPANCTWIPLEEQGKTSRRVVLVEAFGEVKSISEWARDDRCKVTKEALWRRLRKMGMEPEQAILSPDLRKHSPTPPKNTG